MFINHLAASSTVGETEAAAKGKPLVQVYNKLLTEGVFASDRQVKGRGFSDAGGKRFFDGQY